MECVLLYGSTALPGIMKQAGPGRIATELRNHGFSVIAIDVGPIHKSNQALLEKLLAKYVSANTLWVGVTTTFMPDFLGGDISWLTALCSKINPNVKFIAGGSHSLMSAKFYTFKGFADREVVEFTKWCKDPSYAPEINKIGRMVDCTEFADFSTSQIVWHETDGLEPDDTLPIEISRGCIFKCKFCAFPLNGKRKGEWVKRPEVLREELIRNYETHGINKYFLSDDTYNDSVEKIERLYDEVYSKLDFKLDLTCYLRLDLVHRFPHTAELLAASGIRSAIVGIETNNDKSARAIGKGLGFDKQISFLRSLKQGAWSNTLVHGCFILGLPYDTRESIHELETFFTSSNNPLDDWTARPLSLTPINANMQRKYYSEFDLEYEKYGYVTSADTKWVLPNQDLTYDYCDQVSERINQTGIMLDNCKFGAQGYVRMSSIIDRDVVFNTSRKDLRSKYDIKQLIAKKHQRYYDQLLSAL